MVRNAVVLGALLASLQTWHDRALAQTPLGTAFTYQGQLKDGGSPASGPYDMHFRLYDAAAGGTQFGPVICCDNANVTDGLFTVLLDFGDQFAGQERFIEVAIRVDTGLNCANTSGFTSLSPRQKLTAAPNALNADKLDGLDSAAFLQAIPNPLALSGSSGTYIIRAENTSTVGGASSITGLSSGPTGAVHGGRFETASNSGRGAYGWATSASGTTYGIYGRADSTSGRGVYGHAVATSGDARGVFGVSNSTSGLGTVGYATATTGTCFGVYGQSDSTSGRGVYGTATASSGTTYGGYFTSNSPDGYGVFGSNVSPGGTGAGFGGYFETNTADGNAVFGRSTHASGFNFGGRFETDSSFGYGVFGWARASSGINYGVEGASASTAGRGVYGYASASSGTTYGVYGQTRSTDGFGVYGTATETSGTNYGGYFRSASSYGTGVVGIASATGGPAVGVYGSSGSSGGYAVRALSSATSGLSYGVYSISQSSDGRGVYGYASSDSGSTYGGRFESDSPTGRGVYGYVNSTGASDTPQGVRGYCSTATAGYAIYASGDMGASGTKSFRIEHPSDPENKYLLHYSVESPEVLNAYSGMVTLDGSGEAVVELPAYFASINKEPRYALTAVGAAMPNLHVAEEISEAALRIGEQTGPGETPPLCSFRIAGGAPRSKVSWRVEAVRNDLRMRLHGAPVEREKTGPERGRYQHPEYFGQPPEKGMDYDAEREQRSQERPGPTPGLDLGSKRN
ncbi:MAG: hypothetical protein IT450_09595 [Phycisphaerales bacterium]|nr:hypothetical protein [Phycisphaerales bacterium]